MHSFSCTFITVQPNKCKTMLCGTKNAAQKCSLIFVCFSIRFWIAVQGLCILTWMNCPFIIDRSECLYSDCVKCSARECMNHWAVMQGRIPWWNDFFSRSDSGKKPVDVSIVVLAWKKVNGHHFNAINSICEKYNLFVYCFAFAS